jgi:hypothetical protein
MIRSFHDQLARRIDALHRLLGRSDGQALIEFALIISMTGSSVRAVLGSISGGVSGSQLGQTQTTGQTTTTTPAPPAGKKKKKG